ncbi:MAG: arginine--tRNA ligase [Acidobacteria bacterium]|nr:arginine--tRNA ligase [Acidobacteriota bacterium]MCI0719256.1 arginine--tRNA ligase [Acidobacteriota bacterium]
MLVSLTEQIKQRFITHVQNHYGHTLTQLIVEQPPKTEMGDLAFPFCFELAKVAKKAPRQVATEIVNSIGDIAGAAKVQVAGPGYINVFFQRDTFFTQLFLTRKAPAEPASSGKIILEHTNINPNKAAHIGHLRNAVLGDTFARLLRFQGRDVEVQNYVDDTGVQVADVVVGFQHIENKTLEDVQAITGKFDYYCWDLYAKVSSFYEQSAQNAKLRGEALQRIEEGHNETAELAGHIAHRIVECHLNTMQRLGIEYNLLPKESDILHLRFWSHAFELLKKHGAIHFETSGKNQGCWIMRVGEKSTTKVDGSSPESNVDKEHDEDKIIVRSNGTVTYVGKDIAYQLWKLGLLGMDFFYHPFYRYANGQVAYMTNAESNREIEDPAFGGGSEVYNVIDSRQAYLQNIVIAGLRALGFHEQADRSTHFSYEMVALSPRCCEDLGIQLSEEDKQRPYIEVSGRKGLGVKADDLVDTLIDKSLQEVASRHADFSEAETRQTATTIAISALRYFLLKFTRNSVIAFDFKEALSFEGETGPYVQYAVVRASNIFRKVQDDDPACNAAGIRQAIEDGSLREFLSKGIEDELWKLIYLAAQLETNVSLSIQMAEPSTVAKYLFSLAQAFNNFYHKHRIIVEPDPLRKRFLLGLTQIIHERLLQGLQLLGIQVPDKM